MPRYLTKSLFKMALACPTKLYYAASNDEYANKKMGDPFLEALAEGGFQVGELAKMEHAGGITVEATDNEEALAQTAHHLQQKNVTLFEAAFRYENLLIRADIIIKKGKRIELTEVKAKSFKEGAETF